MGVVTGGLENDIVYPPRVHPEQKQQAVARGVPWSAGWNYDANESPRLLWSYR